MLVYTVFAPKAFPQVRKPIINSTTFKIIVIADMESGAKLESIIARPEILLTEAWLGIKKKYTAAAMIATARVSIIPSLIHSVCFE